MRPTTAKTTRTMGARGSEPVRHRGGVFMAGGRAAACRQMHAAAMALRVSAHAAQMLHWPPNAAHAAQMLTGWASDEHLPTTPNSLVHPFQPAARRASGGRPICTKSSTMLFSVWAAQVSDCCLNGCLHLDSRHAGDGSMHMHMRSLQSSMHSTPPLSTNPMHNPPTHPTEKATPKAILVLMRTPGLKLPHVKSHLQRCRMLNRTASGAAGGDEYAASGSDGPSASPAMRAHAGGAPAAAPREGGSTGSLVTASGHNGSLHGAGEASSALASVSEQSGALAQLLTYLTHAATGDQHLQEQQQLPARSVGRHSSGGGDSATQNTAAAAVAALATSGDRSRSRSPAQALAGAAAAAAAAAAQQQQQQQQHQPALPHSVGALLTSLAASAGASALTGPSRGPQQLPMQLQQPASAGLAQPQYAPALNNPVISALASAIGAPPTPPAPLPDPTANGLVAALMSCIPDHLRLELEGALAAQQELQRQVHVCSQVHAQLQAGLDNQRRVIGGLIAQISAHGARVAPSSGAAAALGNTAMTAPFQQHHPVPAPLLPPLAPGALRMAPMSLAAPSVMSLGVLGGAGVGSGGLGSSMAEQLAASIAAALTAGRRGGDNGGDGASLQPPPPSRS